MVLRLVVKRHTDLGRLRNRSACRLHALLCELAAGGISKEITPNKAQRLLDTLTPTTPVERTAISSPRITSRTCGTSTRSCTSRVGVSRRP